MSLNLDINKISSRLTPLLAYLEKKRENQKNVKSVEIGGTFFLISFFILFAIKPTFLTISSLLGDIKSKEELTKQLKQKISDIIVAQDLFSQVQEKYYLVESSLPNQPRFFHANSQIIGNSTNNQISIDRLNYTVKELDYYSTNINTSGTFSTSLAMISNLLQNRRLIDLDGMIFTVNEDLPGQVVNISIPLKVYYWNNNVKK